MVQMIPNLKTISDEVDPEIETRKKQVEELRAKIAEPDVEQVEAIHGMIPTRKGKVYKEKQFSKEEVTEIVEKQLGTSEEETDEKVKKIVIVTGGAGFMGSHLIKRLNDQGDTNILLVDDLSDPSKLQNINQLRFKDYADKSKFIELLAFLAENNMIERIYHFGAESSRHNTDGKYMMENNYQYTCNIMDLCYLNQIPLVFASSATVYGQRPDANDQSDEYTPESYYAFSKLQTDRYSRKYLDNPNNTIIGLRYFNVTSKNGALQWMIDQYEWEGHIELYEGSKEVKRDFVDVGTALWMTMNAMTLGVSGIYNIGTGNQRTFYDLALDIVEDESEIKFIPMPENIAQGYQRYTKANMHNAPFGTTQNKTGGEGV
tara:strand:+ start:539 stop:1660 length:1122 start_codon:yes stop_codon:yes gene_type:complete